LYNIYIEFILIYIYIEFILKEKNIRQNLMYVIHLLYELELNNLYVRVTIVNNE